VTKINNFENSKWRTDAILKLGYFAYIRSMLSDLIQILDFFGQKWSQ